MFKNKILLITGGTGSFGNAMLKGFLESDLKEIIENLKILCWIIFKILSDNFNQLFSWLGSHHPKCTYRAFSYICSHSQLWSEVLASVWANVGTKRIPIFPKDFQKVPAAVFLSFGKKFNLFGKFGYAKIFNFVNGQNCPRLLAIWSHW